MCRKVRISRAAVVSLHHIYINDSDGGLSKDGA